MNTREAMVELRERKAATEKELALVIEIFENETGLKVGQVLFDRVEADGPNQIADNEMKPYFNLTVRL